MSFASGLKRVPVALARQVGRSRHGSATWDEWIPYEGFSRSVPSPRSKDEGSVGRAERLDDDLPRASRPIQFDQKNALPRPEQ